MATSKIKIGDNVVVRKGADKGKSGKVLKLNADKTKVLVDGVNIRTRHQKQNQLGQTAGIFKEPRMISVANVGIAHPSKKSVTTRVKFEQSKDGAKTRVMSANGKEIK